MIGNKIINQECPFKDECNHIDCGTFCQKLYKCNYYFEGALIPKDKRFKTPLRVDNNGNDTKAFITLSKTEKTIEDFITNGNNLYIYSKNVGNGKTSWALRLVREYINKVWYKKDVEPIALFIHVPAFLLELKASLNKESDYVTHILNNVKNCDLVVWDDIGNKAGTVFETDYLLSLIDSRINNNKSNIYTSNLNQAELHEALGDRLYSRIFNYSDCIELVGKDKRGI